MPRKLISVGMVAVVAVLANSAQAFSLLGPLTNNPALSWQTREIGYSLPGDFGGPVNIGEEYRINIPVLTYAFDQSFLDYFGQQGVEAVEAAIAVFNALPPASEINLNDYPTENVRLNDTAASLGIQDLKSVTMSVMIELMGLAEPERWTWALRGRRVINNFTNYAIIQRNFDPVTWQPTNRVNSAFYTYRIEEPIAPGIGWLADATEVPFPPTLGFPFTSVAGGLRGGFLEPGEFFPGLTRDDVGGLKYLYRNRNYNVEQLPLNTVLSSTSTNIFSSGSGGGTNVNTNIPPWTVLFTGTNSLFGTNFFGPIPPWTPFIPLTNLLGTNVFGTNIFGTNVVTNVVVDTALRPGIEKIRFRRRNFDSLLGQQFPAFTNTYTDVVISNYTRFSQRVDRAVFQPDILFAAEDLGLSIGLFPFLVSRGASLTNNDAINGNTTLAGPGIIRPPMIITYTTLLPVFFEDAIPGSGPPEGPDPFDPLFRFFFNRSMIWGSFNGTAEPPKIFPNSISIEDLEALVERSP